MANFLIVEVQSVTSNIPRSNFKEDDLDVLADTILESGGILKPLVLKKTGFEKYEVIDGHFEYYAAVRAREKNPHKGEIVNAFIISSEKEDAVLTQVEVLKAVESSEKPDISELLQQNKRIYAKISQLFSNPPGNTEKSYSDEKIKAIETKLDNLSTALEELTVLLVGLIPPPKLNLVTANEQEVNNALEEVGMNSKYRTAAWEAIRYWQQPGKSLTWSNLKKSCGSSKENKINNFGKGTYEKLKEIADIRPKS